MSLGAVARKDFEDAVRSRWLLALSALFVVLVSLAVYLIRPAAGQTAPSNAVLNYILVKDGLVTTLIPLIALVVSYSAVVGERDSGSLKLLLSLPHSRAEVVFGKVLGRSGAISVPVLVGFLLPGFLLVVVPGVRFLPGYYVGYTLLTALLAAVFVAIAVGFSAAMSSQRLAVGGAVGIYFLFVPLWGVIQFPLRLYLGVGGGPSWLPVSGTGLLNFLQLLNPTGSFKIVVNAFMAGSLFTSAQGVRPVDMQIAAVVMLVAWLLVPPLLGLWQFERADL
ncbi:ABC transporter permease subunit [Halorarum halobium]|uniref:ABC transporter permease subunit n=1 Tax=Halorarum halobium TaxID=3075121 RepID=UPI0028A75047|nr:ABC transporter permease subunit [Halobaculum sp. XH14]